MDMILNRNNLGTRFFFGKKLQLWIKVKKEEDTPSSQPRDRHLMGGGNLSFDIFVQDRLFGLVVVVALVGGSRTDEGTFMIAC